MQTLPREHDKVWGAPNAGDCIPVEVACAAPHFVMLPILKALPRMAKKAHGGELKKALESHRQETEGQIERLEKVFRMLNVPARGRKCEAIEGILGEAKEHMGEIEDADVLDASVIGFAQAIEHYEICRYGTLVEWGKDLGFNDVVELLQQTLKQERDDDRLLTQVARSMSHHQPAA